MGQRVSSSVKSAVSACVVRDESPDGSKKVRFACCSSRSLCGEDAFYREAVQERREGRAKDDKVLATVSEQAHLKLLKAATFSDYAAFEVKTQAMSCMLPRSGSGVGSAQLVDFHSVSRGRLPSVAAWQPGTTIPEWRGPDLPATGEGPYWSKGTGHGLSMRCGPDYGKQLKKQASAGAMYEAVGLDIVKADVKVENLIGRLISKELPQRRPSVSDSEMGAGVTLSWHDGCPIPRVLCINLMLPYETGLNPFARAPDPGVSVVGFFRVKPETLKALNSDDPPAAVRLWKEFCAGPVGEPHGSKNDPNRSLDARRNGQTKNLNMLSGLLKMTAFCENPDDVRCPKSFHQYNGKPCLITKSGYIVKGLHGEWMEIGIDVRSFNPLARKMLCSFRGMLPMTKIHYGFWVQAVEDEELPEGLLCDVFAHGVDIVEHPFTIVDPDGSETEG